MDMNLVNEKAKKIKLLVLDVHGVLTTNEVLYDGEGNRIRAFNHADGFGSNVLMLCGVEIAVITRKSKSVEARMKDIGVKRFYATKEKVAKYEELLKELDITDEEVAYVGDELIDMGVMKRVGLAVSPSDANPEVQEISHLVTKKAGGQGVVRELAEIILKAQGKWDKVREKIMSKGW